MKQVECYGKFRLITIEFSIVMEYADGGDIFQMVKNHQKKT